MIDLTRKTNTQAAAQKTLNDIREKAQEDIVEEKQKIEALVAVARDDTNSMNDRIKATKELNRIIPNYNAQLDKTTGKYRENKKALDEYLSSLVHKNEIEGAKTMLADLGKQAAKARIDVDNAKKAVREAKELQKSGVGQSYTTSWGGVGNTTVDYMQKVNVDLEKANNKAAEVKAKQDAIMKTWGNDIKKSVIWKSHTNLTHPVKVF